ncbi:hypothetical protein [Hymenobacter terricola]|uniref:hypothetical protein n=1 Tax=Hymenobacter terricola TaxID=2819236 RepID=UPI001B309B29|nr:hypothetical protein [Hymenobacter terricola]
MNTRVFSLAGLGLLLAGAPALAQQTDIGQTGAAAQANLNTLTSGAPTMLPRATSEGVVGSPYVDNRWLPAQITLSNKLPLAPVLLKYDVLGHRLLMHKPAPSTDSLQLDDRLVERFVLLEPATAGRPAQPHLFRRFREAPLPQQRPDYVEVLHESRYTLLKRPLKTLKKATLQGAYNTSDRHDEIEDKTEYYLRTPEAALVPVKLGLKPLQSAAPALAAELKKAADSQKPKTEADWAAVLNTVDAPPPR